MITSGRRRSSVRRGERRRRGAVGWWWGGGAKNRTSKTAGGGVFTAALSLLKKGVAFSRPLLSLQGDIAAARFHFLGSDAERERLAGAQGEQKEQQQQRVTKSVAELFFRSMANRGCFSCAMVSKSMALSLPSIFNSNSLFSPNLKPSPPQSSAGSTRTRRRSPSRRWRPGSCRRSSWLRKAEEASFFLFFSKQTRS